MTSKQPALALPADGATIFLPGPAGRIEVAADLPPPHEARRGIAVVAHPNPPDGGTMHNKVVTMCARALAESGIAAVRFNFRGAGNSEGAFDNGRGEVLDLLAVARLAQAARPDSHLWPARLPFGPRVARAAVFEWAGKQQPAPTVVRMPETGHFFHRRLLDLRGAIKNGVRKNLPPPLPA